MSWSLVLLTLAESLETLVEVLDHEVDVSRQRGQFSR